jgi:hypothetical protein
LGFQDVTIPPMTLCALEVVTEGAFADVRVNDLPVTLVGLPKGFGRAFIPLPSFIVRGLNQLTARVAAAPDAAGSSLKVEVRIAVFQEGDDFFSSAGRELARVDWAGPTGQAMLSREFQADFGPASWAWSRCQTWSSPDEALADAMSFVRDLTLAFFNNDTNWIEQASQPKFADMAIAFTNVTEAEMKAQVAMALTAERPEPLPPLPPPRPALCASNRLLLLLGPDGQPWLRKRATPNATGAEVLLGKIGASWHIIR